MCVDINPEEKSSIVSASSDADIVMCESRESCEEEQQLKHLPRAQWLDGEDISDVERLRRIWTLRKICEHMQALPSENRAKTLSAFANQTKMLRTITTFTVPPHQLLDVLEDVPQGVIQLLHAQRVPINSTLLESLEPESASRASRNWNRLKRDGYTSKATPAELARWLQNNSYNRRSYAAEAIVEALRELEIVVVNESLSWCSPKLLPEWVAKVLPQIEFDFTRSWSQFRAIQHTVRRKLPMPALASGKFFGEKGAEIKKFVEHLRKKGSEAGVVSAPMVHLKVTSVSRDSPHTVELIVTWDRFERGMAAKVAAAKVDSLIDGLHQELCDHITALYKERLQKNASRRKARADRLQKAGAAYHNWRLTQRMIRKLKGNDSGRRALEIAACTSRKMRPGNGFQRKDVLRQRRRAEVCEKRRRQFKACEELRLWQPSVARDSLDCVAKRTGFAARLHKHFCNCDSEKVGEVMQSFASLRCARDRDCSRQKQMTSKKLKDAARWQKALLDFDIL
jgi:hypothetical protein